MIRSGLRCWRYLSFVPWDVKHGSKLCGLGERVSKGQILEKRAAKDGALA